MTTNPINQQVLHLIETLKTWCWKELFPKERRLKKKQIHNLISKEFYHQGFPKLIELLVIL
jgi:hypothetical protein